MSCATLLLSRIAPLAVAMLLAGCAPAAPGVGPGSAGADVIRAAELDQRLDEDLYTFIQRVRPAWLQTRAPVSSQSAPLIVVVLDGVRQQPGLDPLRTVKAGDVQEVRRLSAADATTRYGTGMTAGAILVTTRH